MQKELSKELEDQRQAKEAEIQALKDKMHD